uniref:Cyclin dependent kinase 2 associated protein 2 n=1 Tax=Bos indicus x Bos taurus TaxID=30522 RepID=A0A4W2GFD8_BOBOX
PPPPAAPPAPARLGPAPRSRQVRIQLHPCLPARAVKVSEEKTARVLQCARPAACPRRASVCWPVKWAWSPGSVPSPSGSVPGAAGPFRPLFNDFGPPSMGYVQAMKPPGAQGSQSTYTDLLSVIEEMGKEIRPTYAGSKSAMERLKRGIIHARALVRECLAETERNART